MKIDLLLKNAEVFNTYTKKFHRGNVAVLGEKVFHIDRDNKYDFDATEVIDCEGKYLVPGFVDIHMHIESSMTTPELFCDKVASYGVTTIVSEPHEIANVFGKEGVMEMIKAGKAAKIDVLLGIPSSVPSTSEELETTGGVVNYDDMIALSKEDGVVCVGEVMNYAQIIKENDLDITRFLKYIKKENPQYIIEGHCPRLMDLDLSKFLYLGIDGDHTEHTLEEVKQRFENGMFVEIQHKMLDEEIVSYINENNLHQFFSLVTDDVMADDFAFNGHLNLLVKRAVEMGMRFEDALVAATYNPSLRMNLRDRGTIAPGRLADMVLIDSLESMEVLKTFKRGKKIYEKGQEFIKKVQYKFPEKFYNSINIEQITEENLKIKVNKNIESVKCRVMEVRDGGTSTKETVREIRVHDGILNWEESDTLLVAVFERYGKSGNVGFGLVTGDIIKEGAVATTYAHDHHNLLVVGKNIEDMVLAVNTVIESKGGYAVCEKGEIKGLVKLPIGGILSEEPIDKLGLDMKVVKREMRDLGYNHYNPIMSLSTLSLPVSPDLKISDKGLILVKESKIVPLFFQEVI